MSDVGGVPTAIFENTLIFEFLNFVFWIKILNFDLFFVQIPTVTLVAYNVRTVYSNYCTMVCHECTCAVLINSIC